MFIINIMLKICVFCIRTKSNIGNIDFLLNLKNQPQNFLLNLENQPQNVGAFTK